jgi:hypothetical protein
MILSTSTSASLVSIVLTISSSLVSAQIPLDYNQVFTGIISHYGNVLLNMLSGKLSILTIQNHQLSICCWNALYHSDQTSSSSSSSNNTDIQRRHGHHHLFFPSFSSFDTWTLHHLLSNQPMGVLVI